MLNYKLHIYQLLKMVIIKLSLLAFDSYNLYNLLCYRYYIKLMEFEDMNQLIKLY